METTDEMAEFCSDPGNAAVMEALAKDERPMTDEDLLLYRFRLLGPKAKAVLFELSGRLVDGMLKYREDLDGDRDWNQMTLEEELDASVYRCVELMGRRKP